VKAILDLFNRDSRSKALPATAWTSSSNNFSTIGRGNATVYLNAMGTNGTLFSVVTTYATSTSLVCWKLWKKSKSGIEDERTEVTTHRALDVWNMPNPLNPQQLFIESFQQHVELVGEAWWIVDYFTFDGVNKQRALGPSTMQLVRPDKMEPVWVDGVVKYIYRGPNGEDIPFEQYEVVRLLQPDPNDPSPLRRGLGAVQTILSQLEGVNLAGAYNRNFFANSAVPGGIIKVKSSLSDREFDRLSMQFEERHRGVTKAGRVAILEEDTDWQASSLGQRDMQLVEMLDQSRDVIREAFGMPEFMLGKLENANRASGEASDVQFSNHRMVPRLERIKHALNTQFLPLFGAASTGLEFDYENPVPPDLEDERKDMTSKVNNFRTLVLTGVDPAEAAELLDLPQFKVVAPPNPSTSTPNDPAYTTANPDTPVPSTSAILKAMLNRGR
jgi:HK97 family phage portal protein